MLVFNFLTDPHFTNSTPSSRKDEYPTTIINKYRSIQQFSPAPIQIIGGDIAHRSILPLEYINRIAREEKRLQEEYKYKTFIIPGNHDCLDEETEILTKRGWIKFSEIYCYDEVLSLNLKEKITEWVGIKDIIIQDYDGEMDVISNGGIVQVSTPKHRSMYRNMLNSKKKEFDNIELSRIRDSKAYIRFIKSGKNNNKGIELSDDQIRVVAWILTDGSVDSSKYYSIYQSKEKGIDRIRKLLNRLSYNYKESSRDRVVKEICGKVVNSVKKCHTFYLRAEASKELFSYVGQKEFKDILYEMNTNQFRVFLEELVWGDGSFYGDRVSKGTYLLYGEKWFLDKVQVLCILNGYTANLIEYRKGCFRLNISDRNEVNVYKTKSYSKIHYKGKVWCLTVKNSNFMVRRNGYHYFTGNSKYSNLEYLEDSVVGNWLGTGLVERLENIVFTIQDGFYVRIVGWNYEETEIPVVEKSASIVNILVGHAFYETAPTKNKDLVLTRDQVAESNYDIILLGHDHSKFEPTVISRNDGGQAVVYRPGGFSRGTCYDNETEVLTEKGWMLFKDVNIGDKVYSLNDNRPKLEEVLDKIEKEVDGNLLRYKTSQVDLKVTPNHMMYVKEKGKENFFKQRADSLFKFSYDCLIANEPSEGIDEEWMIIPDRERNGKIYPGCRISMERFLKFLGLWIANGSLDHSEGTGYNIIVTQSKKNIDEKFIKILEDTGWRWRDKGRKDGSCNYSHSDYALFSWLVENFKFEGKYKKSGLELVPRFIFNLSKKYIESFLEGYWQGDGTQCGKRKCYYSSSKQMINDIQHLLFLVGRSGRFVEIDRRGPATKNFGKKTKLEYRILDRGEKKFSEISRNSARYGEEEYYNGKVYCLTVPSGLLYVRRRGKPVWCGNSHFTQIWREVSIVRLEFSVVDNKIYKNVSYVNIPSIPPEQAFVGEAREGKRSEIKKAIEEFVKAVINSEIEYGDVGTILRSMSLEEDLYQYVKTLLINYGLMSVKEEENG